MTHFFKPSIHSLKAWSDPIKLGNIQLKNRVCMAALTRQRCNPADGVPNKLNLQYYSQRRGAGMILTQSTAYTKRGQLYPGAPGLYNLQQAQGWYKIVSSLHDLGAKIFLQLFHAGRATHPKLNGGLQPFAPSAIRVQQQVKSLTNQYFPVPKAMTLQDIESTKQQFAKSVKLAKQVGFDGIEYHASTGFLSDSFIRSKTNKRTDCYGGSIENRCRFPLQMLDILIKHFQPTRIGVKLSPATRTNDVEDNDPLSTFTYLIKQINKKKIGFLQMRELYHRKVNQQGVDMHQQVKDACKVFRQHFDGILIANDGFTPRSGIEKIRNNEADMISFGRLYISNPDLAERIINNEQVNTNWDSDTFYGYQHGPKGYTDYKRYKL